MKTISQPYRKNHLLLDSTANAAAISAVVLVLASVVVNSFDASPASTEQLASRTPHATRVAVDTNATTTPAPVAVEYRANSSLVAAQ